MRVLARQRALPEKTAAHQFRLISEGLPCRPGAQACWWRRGLKFAAMLSNLVECGMSFAYTPARSAACRPPMEAEMDADIELAAVVLSSRSAHVFMVLGLNAVASMIDMFGFADP